MSQLASPHKLDLIVLTATELQALLSSGELTSRKLVEQCLAQIETHDRQGMTLRAIIAVTPEEELLKIADDLDKERSKNKLRGPLHGIPIIDVFNTRPDLRMKTTLGSFALVDAENDRQAPLLDKLEENGLILLGKTNMSEFSGVKGRYQVRGFSALGGQCQSPYIKRDVELGDEVLGKINPGGSSTGSAVGVAAGYSPLSLGTDSNGSIHVPASRSSLFALKCTPQSIPSVGTLLIAPTFESPGGMAKSVEDLAALIEIIVSISPSPVQLPKVFSTSWSSIKLGFVGPKAWLYRMHPDKHYLKQFASSYEEAIRKIRGLGGSVYYPLDLVHPSDIVIGVDYGYDTVLMGEMRDSVNKYLESLPHSPIRSLAGIIEFNDDNPTLQVGTDQMLLREAQENDTSANTLREARKEVKKMAGEEGIEKVLDQFDLDAIVAPADSAIHALAALAGCPSATMPLGYQPLGRPFGLCIVARAGEEGKLLDIMSAYEATLPARQPPQPLYEAESAM